MSHDPLDQIFKALSDPTRRKVLERLGERPVAVSELAAPFDMALPSFVQHMRVLEDAGLVTSKKAGRVRTYKIAPRRFDRVDSWLSQQRTMWTKRLDQLDEFLKTTEGDP